jgi:hypothetical protein
LFYNCGSDKIALKINLTHSLFKSYNRHPMETIRVALLAILFFACNTLYAQEKSKIKYGKVTPVDFVLPDSAFLQNADAVYIADIGETNFEGNTKSWFSLKFKRHIRIKVNNNNGVTAADFAIPMYFDNVAEEKVENLKGITYNLENGNVVETELKSNNVFDEKRDKKFRIRKFSMTGVKAGSIVDVSYTISSDFLFNLHGWEFQGQYPRMWSEYEVGIPEYFNYIFLSQGHLPFAVNAKSERQGRFTITIDGGASQSDRVNLDGRVLVNRWVMKNVPALKEEPFTTSVDNHICKIEFQENQYQLPNSMVRHVMPNWPAVVKSRNENEYFGANLYKSNNWLDDEMKKVVGNSTDTLEKIKKVYAYVRDNFTCTQHSGVYLQDDGLRGIFKRKNGSVAEINLLLTAMLNHEKVESYPILLSTRANGIAHEYYPLMDRYNYTVCVAFMGDNEFLLDASEPHLAFGKLPLRCFNGPARVITGEGIPVMLSADNIKERKVATLNMIVNEQGKWEGAIQETMGYYESLTARNSIKENGKEAFFKSLQQAIPNEFKVVEKSIEKLDEKDENLQVKFDFALDNDGEDIIYFNPMMNEGLKDNPFKSAERKYPVEMNYTLEDIYVATIEVPKGYTVDELPKSTKVMLNGEDGSFEYLIAQQDGKVMLRSKMVIKRANFEAEDYQTLRDFFGYIVKKHGEQIVFKKG